MTAPSTFATLVREHRRRQALLAIRAYLRAGLEGEITPPSAMRAAIMEVDLLLLPEPKAEHG